MGVRTASFWGGAHNTHKQLTLSLMAAVPRSKGELTGLEWEAEKAYIVATSPRSVNQLKTTDSNDDFSFETVVVTEKPVNIEALQTNAEIESPKDLQNEDGEDTKEKEMVIKEEIVSESPLQSDVHTQLTTSTPPQSSSLPTSPLSTQEMQLKFDTPESSISSPHSLSTYSLQNYTPPIDTAKKSITKPTLVVYGPSGFGKGLLVQKMVYRSPQQFALVVSHTTRQPRLHEMYARDFYFVSKTDMLQKIKQKSFMEFVQIDDPDIGHTYTQQTKPRRRVSSLSSTSGELYGTSVDAYHEAKFSNKPCTVLNISTKGAEQLQQLGIEGEYVLIHPGSDPEEVSSNIEPNYTISIDNKEEAFGLLEDYALGLIRGKTVVGPIQLERVKEEWERVPTIQLEGAKSSPVAKARRQQLSHKPTSFGELLNHFQNANLSEQLSLIKPEAQTTKLSKLLGPPRIEKKLRHERDMIFAIALCKFDDHNQLHMRSLATVHRRLMGGKTTSCSRFGKHWEDIGFQGSDPIDDLRGVGMLGIVQLVWLLETPLVQLLALEVYRYSRETEQKLPFCVLSLNITCIALQALREGCLSRECNRKEQVFAVFNDFYAAIMLSFYHSWQRHQRGPMELGLLLQNIGAFAKKHARFFVHELQVYLEEREQRETLSSPQMIGLRDDTQIEFTVMEMSEPRPV